MPGTAKLNESVATDSDNEETNRLECPQCSRTFAHNDSLRSHLSRTCGIPKRFKCKYCLQKFRRKDNVKEHEKLHCPERRTKMNKRLANTTSSKSSYDPKCAVCSKTFPSSAALDKHHSRTKCGSLSKPFQCCDCRKNYKSELALNIHKQRFCVAGNQKVAAAKSNGASASTGKPRPTRNSSGKRAPHVDLSSDSEKEDATPMSSSSSEQESSSGLSSAANSKMKRQRIESETSSHCSDDSYPTGFEAQSLLPSRNGRSSHSSNNVMEEKHLLEDSKHETSNGEAKIQSRSNNGVQPAKTDQSSENLICSKTFSHQKSNGASVSTDATANSNETSKEEVNNVTKEIEPEKPRSSTHSNGQQNDDPMIVDLTIDLEEEEANPAPEMTPQVEKPAKKLKRESSCSSGTSGQGSSSGVSAVVESQRKCQRRDSETSSHCSNDSNPTGPEAQSLTLSRNRDLSFSSEKLIKQEQSTDKSEQQVSDDAGAAQASASNESEPTTTGENVSGESSSLQQKEEIESQRRLLAIEKGRIQLQLRLLEIEKKEEELARDERKVK